MKLSENCITFVEHAANLPEKDILSYILKFTVKEEKIDTVCSALFDHFGTLKNILEGRPEQIASVKGVTAKTAEHIACFLPIVKTWERISNETLETIRNSREAEKYCLSLLAGERTERFYVVCVNAQCKVIGYRKITEGSLSEVSAYPRIVAETALNYNAHSVFLCHNHPGGTLYPSSEDVKSTEQLQTVLSMLGIQVYDHIIVAGNQTYSMIQHGDISYFRNSRR